MKLRVCSDVTDVKDTFICTYKMLQDKTVHLFIASNVWDVLQVELSEEIPRNVLSYIKLRCKKISVRLPQSGASTYITSLLIELYPEKAGQIRKYSMLHRLPEILDTF